MKWSFIASLFIATVIASPTQTESGKKVVMIAGVMRGESLPTPYMNELKTLVDNGYREFIMGNAKGVDKYSFDFLSGLKNTVPDIKITRYDKKKEGQEELPGIIYTEGSFIGRDIMMLKKADHVVAYLGTQFDFGSSTFWSLFINWAKNNLHKDLTIINNTEKKLKALQQLRIPQQDEFLLASSSIAYGFMREVVDAEDIVAFANYMKESGRALDKFGESMEKVKSIAQASIPPKKE